MNWDALGAVAELVGAIAVVVTFVFLTVQLRQNTQAIEHATSRAVFEDAYTWMYKVAENPEMADLYLAGMNGEPLSSRDRLRFALLLNTLFTHWGHAFDAGAFEIVNNSQIAGVLARPGGAAHWERTIANQSIILSPGFIAHVESLKPGRGR